jgi:hypothetical protein
MEGGLIFKPGVEPSLKSIHISVLIVTASATVISGAAGVASGITGISGISSVATFIPPSLGGVGGGSATVPVIVDVPVDVPVDVVVSASTPIGTVGTRTVAAVTG